MGERKGKFGHEHVNWEKRPGIKPHTETVSLMPEQQNSLFVLKLALYAVNDRQQFDSIHLRHPGDVILHVGKKNREHNLKMTETTGLSHRDTEPPHPVFILASKQEFEEKIMVRARPALDMVRMAYKNLKGAALHAIFTPQDLAQLTKFEHAYGISTTNLSPGLPEH